MWILSARRKTQDQVRVGAFNLADNLSVNVLLVSRFAGVDITCMQVNHCHAEAGGFGDLVDDFRR